MPADAFKVGVTVGDVKGRKLQPQIDSDKSSMIAAKL
jgi:hypothetical protein